jgi:arginyl-tRNA synthetase
MSDLVQQLAARFEAALTQAFDVSADPLIAPSTNPKFGDFQANVAMSLGKQLKRKPRDVAQEIVDALDVDDLCESVDIAGPGFINLKLKAAAISEALQAAIDLRVDDTQTVVVDYGGPNVAKEMHVGHLRSTIIGDAIVRVLEAQGHAVIKQNHVGDWGTQFGMLIEHMLDIGWDQQSGHGIGDLNALYQQAKKHFDDDADFAARARQRVVKLQGGDEQTLALWRELVAESERHFQAVYDRLDVRLSTADVRGESAYNDQLADVAASLKQLGVLTESEGAGVVFLDGFVDREGNPLPLIVRKADGGYLYATTDLAAARYRVRDLGADRVVYVTDARQSQHFAMVFATLRKVGWPPPEVRLDHVPFGTMLGADRKPFKTRSGELVKLVDLLDEAEQRATKVLAEKNTGLSPEAQAAVAHVVGVGAMKYADLSTDRVKDYVFDWDRMLAMDGNTAPYLQNAYVRIRSIFRKGGIESADGVAQVNEAAERALALKLLQLPGVVQAVADKLEPHRLCGYLYEVASAFHQFYEHCPVLTAPDEATRDSRLALCARTAQTLKQGLELLGIGVVDQM